MNFQTTATSRRESFDLSGQVASGIVRHGQPVAVLPSGVKTTVTCIWTYDGPLAEAFCPQSVTLRLEHDLEVNRGDMIVGLENLPGRSADLQARVCWMHQRLLQPGKKYFLKRTTQTVQAVITQIECRIDIILRARAESAIAGVE